MCPEFVVKWSTRFCLLLLLWMGLSFYFISTKRLSWCVDNRYYIDRILKIRGCGQNPKPPQKITWYRICKKNTCLYKYARWRRPQRIGQESNPELLQYPKAPDFAQDTHFCLVLDPLQYVPQDNVTFSITVGHYACNLLVWTANSTEPASDVQKIGKYVYARFGAHLFGDYNRVSIRTSYGRLKQQSWDFALTKTQRAFRGGQDRFMEPCLEALRIEGTGRFPQDAVPIDHCAFHAFKLSYPQQCTSLRFQGEWKRGQTVTLSKWTVSLIMDLFTDKCVDIGAAHTYEVVSEFSDRHIEISPRQLRGGLNRLCNDFLFTGTFGTEGDMNDYGPFDLKICGYLLVDPKPCIQIVPMADELELTHLPLGELFTLDASRTIEEGQPRAKYEWSCILISTGKACNITFPEEPVMSFMALHTLVGERLRLTLTVTHYFHHSGTPIQASQSRLLRVVDVHNLLVHIRCLTNCHPRAVSVHPVVLRVVCEYQCQNPKQLLYHWKLYNVTGPPGTKKLIFGSWLNQLVDNGEMNKMVFRTSGAGNIFLETVFVVCVTVSRRGSQGRAEACHKLDFRGAPVPSPGDGCVIMPYDAELPGFLSQKHHGLCNWQAGNQSLDYKVYTYDVGVPEHERQYNLVAFSDLPRLPDMEMPFGNSSHDFELGVIFMISNDQGLTYVYDIKESFDKIGVVFKVRKPVDFRFLDKVEEIADKMLDSEKSGHFGSRQGALNVAGLVAGVMNGGGGKHIPGLSKEKRMKIQWTVMASLLPFANSERNTVLQMTPIVEALTRPQGREVMSTEMEETGALVLLPLTEGLSHIAVTDYRSAHRLAKLQYSLLDRISERNVLRQENALLENVSQQAKEHFLKRASMYAQMYMNIGQGMVASSMDPDTPQVQESRRSSITAFWTRLRPNSTLSIAKPRSKKQEFGCAIHVDGESLNVSPGTELDVVMTVNENNLFVFGNSTESINMPMVNMEIKHRGSSRTVHTSNLSSPADIFIQRTATSELQEVWVWERINLTDPADPVNNLGTKDSDPSYVLASTKTLAVPASPTHSRLMKLRLSNSTFTIKVSVRLLSEEGGRRELVYNAMDYPRKGQLKSYKGVRQKRDIVFLPRLNDSSSEKQSYEVTFHTSSSLPPATTYGEEDAPYVQMLLANISCSSWNHEQGSWNDSGCEVTDLSNLDVLHCQCRHLSIFSGGLLVPANPLDLTNVKLFLQVFSNPAVVSVVVFIWLVYFILVCWAREEDWLDTFRSRVAVLEDNQLSDQSAYLVCCVTGWWLNSGTTAKVFIYLKGTEGLSRVHRLVDAEQALFSKGAENWFILTTAASLGKIKSVVVWHDSSGNSPAWFLKEVLVQDINCGDSWHCLYDNWISVEHGTGDLCVEVPALTPEAMHRKRLYQTVLKTSLGFRNGHIWMSIVLKPPYSPFTRVQRLTCALCILMTTMLSNMMFYEVPSTDPKYQVSSGPVRLNLFSLVKGIQASLVVIPINMLLVQLFSRTSQLPAVKKLPLYYTFDEAKLVKLEERAARTPSDILLEEKEEVERHHHRTASGLSVAGRTVHFSGQPPPDHHCHHPPSHDHHHPPSHDHHHPPCHDSSSSEDSSSEDVEDGSSSHLASSDDGAEGHNIGINWLSPFFLWRKAKHESVSSASHYSASSLAEVSVSSEFHASSKSNTEVFASRSESHFAPSEEEDTNVSARTADQTGPPRCSVRDALHSPSEPRLGFSVPTPSLCSDSLCNASGSSTKSELSVDDLRFQSGCGPSCVPASGSDANNSAAVTSTGVENEGHPQQPRLRRIHHRSSRRRLGQQFSLITTTAWFQTAVTFLRKNIHRTVKERTERSQEGSKHLNNTNTSGSSNARGQISPGTTERGKPSTTHGLTYFDRLKRKAQNRVQQKGDRLESTQSGITDIGENIQERVAQKMNFRNKGGETQTTACEKTRHETETRKTIEKHAYSTVVETQQGRQERHTRKHLSDIVSNGGGGDRKECAVRGKSSKLSYLDKLKARKQNQHQLDLEDVGKDEQANTDSAVSTDSVPKGCWFCSTVPVHEQTMRHLQIVRRRRQSCDRSSSASGWSPSSEDKGPVEEYSTIPSEAIRQNHDMEFQKASRKGPRALRNFKRQAAQCMAEDILHWNRSAARAESWEESAPRENVCDAQQQEHPSAPAAAKKNNNKNSSNNNTNNDKGSSNTPQAAAAAGTPTTTTTGDEEDRKDRKDNHRSPGCCKSCLKACQSRAMSTFACLFSCKCLQKKLPWWTVYLTWTLALSVALFSSWVVMLYGLRLGYQRSVDWLSAFFTGWLHSVMVLQPLKVVAVSLLYILVLKQHVNVREEAGISVHDENDQPMHVSVLKDMEARRALLDGMWTTTDYQYPIPRSKAKDIKLRLEQDARARLILRESLVWALLLVTVTVASLGHTSVTAAYHVNSNLKVMLTQGTQDGIGFEDVSETSHVWEYALSTLLPALFANSSRTTANNVTLVFGSLRLRQIRQKYDEDFCAPFTKNRFFTVLRGSNHCLPYFTVLQEEKRDFKQHWSTLLEKDNDTLTELFHSEPSSPDDENDGGDDYDETGGDGDSDENDGAKDLKVSLTGAEARMVTQAWLYRSAFQLRESPLWGRRAVYPGGGYSVDLPRDLQTAERVVTHLKALRWLDRNSRALVLSANLYTPSKDLITVFAVLCEWTQEGPVLLSLDLHTSKLHWYASDSESYTSSAEMGWLVMMSYNMYREMLQLMRVGSYRYLLCPWTYLELANFFLSLTVIAAQMARVLLVDAFTDEVVGLRFDHYVSFAGPQFLDDTLDLLKALIFMAVTLKVFKVLRFNHYFRILLESFYVARHSILNQTLVAFILFMAFGFASKILFGPYLEDYKSLGSTLQALFNFGVGEGDFYGMQASQAFLGPLLYFLFIVFFTVLTLSFFVTFVLESFNVSRVLVQLNAEEQHVMRYVRRVWRLLIGATPKIKSVRRRRRTHPFKAASFTPL